jgi:hypothetical protein
VGARLGKPVGGLSGGGKQRGAVETIRATKAHQEKEMKWFINSMLGYWILLLTISLGSAAVIYEVWLKGKV